MNYHDITKDDMRNGDGLRVVLWVAGCSHGCRGCHNPITWEVNGGLPFAEAARRELFAELEKDYISGLTLSGGDPLHPANREAITKLAAEVKERFPEKTIWLYTGYCWEKIKDLPVMRQIDVCVDGPFIPEQRDSLLHWKGSQNQRVIQVQASLAAKKAIIRREEWNEE